MGTVTELILRESSQAYLWIAWCHFSYGEFHTKFSPTCKTLSAIK